MKSILQEKRKQAIAKEAGSERQVCEYNMPIWARSLAKEKRKQELAKKEAL